MFDVIAMGGATRDITFLTDKGKVIETPEDLTSQRLLAFEYGAKIRSEEVRMNFGGGACNAAATFSNMGLSAAVISRVGKDGNGKSILENLEKRNINTDRMQIDEELSSAFSFIVVDSVGGDGERVIFSHRGALEKIEICTQEFKGAEWVYLTGLGKNWKEDLGKISDAVWENGIKLAWNPAAAEIAGGKENLKVLLERTEIFIVNKDEAIELVQRDPDCSLAGKDLNEITKLIKIIKGWGAKNVVITDGKNGAHLLTEGHFFKSPAFSLAQADTTGAGDAFGSGLVAGRIISDNWEIALKYAVLNSGGEVSECGAQSGIMSREEIEKKLDEISIKKIDI